MLKEYPTLKLAKQNLEEREREMSRTALQVGGAPRYGKQKIKNEFELEWANIKRQLAYTEATIHSIERCLSQLDNEECRIIRLWYIDRVPKESILHDMYIESLSSLYALKGRAIESFTLRYFGAAAL